MKLAYIAIPGAPENKINIKIKIKLRNRHTRKHTHTHTHVHCTHENSRCLIFYAELANSQILYTDPQNKRFCILYNSWLTHGIRQDNQQNKCVTPVAAFISKFIFCWFGSQESAWTMQKIKPKIRVQEKENVSYKKPSRRSYSLFLFYL